MIVLTTDYVMKQSSDHLLNNGTCCINIIANGKGSVFKKHW